MMYLKQMFRSQLLWRLYAGYVAIILFSMLIVGVLVAHQLTENSMAELHHSLAARSELFSEIAKAPLRESLARSDGSLTPAENSLIEAEGSLTLAEGSFQKAVTQLGKSTGSRLSVIAVDGTVIADSQELAENMDNHGQRPEVIDAREKGYSTISRFSQTLQQQMIYRAKRVTDNQQTIGFVRVALPLSTIDRKLAQLRLIVLFGTGMSALAALLLGFYFARRFSEPLTRMTEVAEAISQGDYNRRINVQQRGEMGTLARAFNRMARNSEQRMAEITTDRNRLATIFAGMVEGVTSVDQDQNIIHINQAAADLLGLSISTCINKPIWEEVRVQEINRALEQAIKGQGIVKAQMRRSSETDDLVIDIYAATLGNSEAESIGAVIVLHDISELDHLMRIRSDFVANASHELKTPITAIRSISETILDDADMEENIRQSFIEKVHAQSLRLSALVSDLLAISRFESGQHQQSFDAVDLSMIARQSAATAVSACRQKQLTLTTDIPDDKLIIDGDMQALSQLIDNLVDNAIKYTPLGGEIFVHLSKNEGKAVFSVRDTGIGVSPQYQQRIFERFYRVDKARSRDLGGTGLGLSIVKNITEQHGGSVTIDSQLAHGPIFTVILPLASDC